MATSPTQPPGKHHRTWWEALWSLIVEVWVGSILFAILFAPAIILDLGVKWLSKNFEVSEFLMILLTGTKYAIAGLDALLYVCFLANMAWLFFLELRWRPSEP